jgi:opacity protein-like surface antigen
VHEEIFALKIALLKKSFLFSCLAALAAASLSLSAAAQAVPESAPPATAAYKWEGYAGFSYTSLNQVNQSRYGLLGGQAAVNRNWGKYFGVRVSGDYNKPALGSGNPGNPSMYSILAGPEIHANLYGNLSGLFFGELGMAHTGGEGMIPSSSVAGGFGGGMAYRLTDRLSIRATGDRLAASFSPIDNTPQLALSTHRTWNPRATIGVAYRF